MLCVVNVNQKKKQNKIENINQKKNKTHDKSPKMAQKC